MFMGDRETLPLRAFSAAGADERIGMAGELGVIMLNPYTKQPVELTVQYERGHFIEPDPAQPVPLHMCVRDGRILTLADLVGLGEEPAEPEEEEPDKGSSRPPMGGRK